MRPIVILLYSLSVLSLIVLTAGKTVMGQSQEKVYASMILNFSRGIQWPMASNDETFIIGVVEYPPLATELSLATEIAKVSGKKVEIREFAYAEDIEKCHVLFVPAYKAKQIPKVMETLGGKPTLIITNKTDYARKTGGINLVLVDGKLKYEINCKSIEKRGMKISSSVKSMGIVVE
jgi:hypothetical protein